MEPLDFRIHSRRLRERAGVDSASGDPRRRIEMLDRAPRAQNQPIEQQKSGPQAVSEFPRHAGAQQAPHNQPQIERTNVNQLTLDNVGVLAKMRSSQAARLVTVRKTPFQQLAAFPQKRLAVSSPRSSPVRVFRMTL